MVQFTSKSLLATALAVTGANACIGPAINSATIDLITSFEGFRADIYTDPTGNPTVGYGHLCSDSSCSDVPYSIPLSEADGRKLFQDDVVPFQDCITNETAQLVTLNLNQYGALVSWSYNVGCGAAGSSTLIARLNNGEDPNTVASEELPQWVYGNGQVLPGLVRRRDAEVDLFKTASSAAALPAPC